MSQGLIQGLNRDHNSWITFLDSIENEIRSLREQFSHLSGRSKDRMLVAADHYLRLSQKLRLAIESHINFVDEIKGEGFISEDLVDLDGHERNHQHLLNLQDGVRKLKHSLENPTRRQTTTR